MKAIATYRISTIEIECDCGERYFHSYTGDGSIYITCHNKDCGKDLEFYFDEEKTESLGDE